MKKVLSILLITTILLSSFNFSVFAADSDFAVTVKLYSYDATTTHNVVSEVTEVEEGDIIFAYLTVENKKATDLNFNICNIALQYDESTFDKYTGDSEAMTGTPFKNGQGLVDIEDAATLLANRNTDGFDIISITCPNSEEISASSSKDVYCFAYIVKESAESGDVSFSIYSEYQNKIGVSAVEEFTVDWSATTELSVVGALPKINSISITDDEGESVSSVTVKGSLEDNDHTYTIKAISTSEKDITSLVDWHCIFGIDDEMEEEEATGLYVSEGILTVKKDAKAGDYTVMAAPIEGKSDCSKTGGYVSTTIKVVHDSVPTSAKFYREDGTTEITSTETLSVFVPFNDENDTEKYVPFKIFDQFEEELGLSTLSSAGYYLNVSWEWEPFTYEEEMLDVTVDNGSLKLVFNKELNPEDIDFYNIKVSINNPGTDFPLTELGEFKVKPDSLSLEWDKYVTVKSDQEYGTINTNLFTIQNGGENTPKATSGEHAYPGTITVAEGSEMQKPNEDGEVQVKLVFTVNEDAAYGIFSGMSLYKTYTVKVNPKKIVLAPTFADYDYGAWPYENWPGYPEIVGMDTFWEIWPDFAYTYVDYETDQVITIEEGKSFADVGVGKYYITPLNYAVPDEYKNLYIIEWDTDASKASPFTISKGTISPAPTGTTSIYYGNHNPMSITVENLTAWTGWDGEPFTSIEGVVLKDGSADKFIVDGTNKTLALGTSAAKDDSATITVTCGSKNFNNADVDITITLVDKTDVSDDIVITDADDNEITGVQEITYGNSLELKYGFKEDAPYKPSEAATGKKWTITYEGRDGTTYNPSETAPRNVGKYKVTFTYEDDETGDGALYGHTGSKSADFEIKRRELGVTWYYKFEGESEFKPCPVDGKYTYCGKEIILKAEFTNVVEGDELVYGPKENTGIGLTITGGSHGGLTIGVLKGNYSCAGNYIFAGNVEQVWLGYQIVKADVVKTDLEGLVSLPASITFSGTAVNPTVADVSDIKTKFGDSASITFTYKPVIDGGYDTALANAPIEVGNYALFAKVNDSTYYNNNEVLITDFEITPKEITVALDTSGVTSREWNGATDVTGTTLTLTGVYTGYAPCITADYAWTSAAVGTNTIMASNIKFDADADEAGVNKNYTLKQPEGGKLTADAPNEVSITKKTKGADSTTPITASANITLFYQSTERTITLSDFTLTNAPDDTSELKIEGLTLKSVAKGSGDETDTIVNSVTEKTITFNTAQVGNKANFTAILESNNYADINATITITMVNVEFVVAKDGSTETATFDNAVSLDAEKEVYGNTWADIVKSYNSTLTAQIDGTKDSNPTFTFYVTPDGGEEVQMSGSPNAGEYTVTLKYTGQILTNTYTNVVVASGTITIDKATPTADLFSYTEPLYLEYISDEDANALNYCFSTDITELDGEYVPYYKGTNPERLKDIVLIHAGEYELGLDVNETTNYTEAAIYFDTIYVNPKTLTISGEPTALTGTYNANNQNLITDTSGCTFDTTNGKIVYCLTEDGDYSDTIPTKKDAGEYTVYYKIVSTNANGDYKDTEPASVTANIAKFDLPPEIDSSKLSNKEYDGTNTVEEYALSIYFYSTSKPGTPPEQPQATATFAWEGVDAGTSTVKATDIALTSDWTKNYKLTKTSLTGVIPENNDEIVKAKIVRLGFDESYLYTTKYEDLTSVLAYGQATTDPGESVTVKWYTDNTYTTEVTATDAIGTSAGTKTLYAKIVDSSGLKNHVVGEKETFEVSVELTAQQSRPDAPSAKKTIFANSTEHGKFSISNDRAKKNQKVIITVTPDSGYVVSSITVVDKNGEYLDVDTITKNSKYSFVANGLKTYVTVKFKLAETDNPFIDVDANKYYYDAVLWAYENGITSGLTAYTFGPNVSCSRAQVVTFLWRAAGCPSPSLSTCAFTDVEAGSYYEQAVLWAVEHGITTGTSATTFSPDDTVTRAQVVTFLYRTVGSKAVATSLAFSDVDPDKYYANAVSWAVAEGITTGTSANTFSPDDDCTRAQIVTFLYRFFGLNK